MRLWWTAFGVLVSLATLLTILPVPIAYAQTCVDDVTGVSNNCTAEDVRIG